ncbi:toxin-antitoxin system HicB family antitoxin [Microbacterium sp. RD1]|uniref:toxin-antitoxin system HicB family antitoxin n=1 Tax=Microbacterium sp. RD1 TaxID=3457313 RepID=UPI003FA55723
MQIESHVEALQRHLVAAAAAGTPETQEIAERLVAALDAAARLALLEALSDAAGEITRDLAPGSVDVRLRAREVDFVVTRPAEDSAAAAATPEAPAPAPAPDDTDDAATSRTTLRISDALKARAEQAASAEGLSLNSWLVRAITAALEPARRAVPESHGSSFTGWVR